MIIKKLHEVEKVNNPHKVESRNIHSTDDLSVTIVTLQPGEKLKKHITPVDVLFYVLEGKGKVLIGEETAEVTAESSIESPKDIAHCWYNNSDAPLKFMVLKAPKPTKKTIFLED
jgi:quercetin dioxygenase-like cupin family protein